jgi:ribosomal protein L20A (L18A)
MEKTTLEVGDIIEISNWASNYTVEIERVTKTKAVTKPYNDAGARHEFKREIDGGRVRPLKSIKWSQTDYKLISKD